MIVVADTTPLLYLSRIGRLGVAERIHADTLLIDERKGRDIARRRGLRIQGTLGLLVVARRAGVFGSLREILDDLAAEGFHVSAHLVVEALRQVGEG